MSLYQRDPYGQWVQQDNAPESVEALIARMTPAQCERMQSRSLTRRDKVDLGLRPEQSSDSARIARATAKRQRKALSRTVTR